MPMATAPHAALTTSTATIPPHWPAAAMAASGTIGQDQGDLIAADGIDLSLATRRTHRRSVGSRTSRALHRRALHARIPAGVSTFPAFQFKLRPSRVVGGGHVAVNRYRGPGGLRSFLVLLTSTFLTEWPRPDIPGKDPYTTQAVTCPYDDSELVPHGHTGLVDNGKGKFRCLANGHLFPQLPQLIQTSTCPYDDSELVDDRNGMCHCQGEQKHFFVLTPGSRN